MKEVLEVAAMFDLADAGWALAVAPASSAVEYRDALADALRELSEDEISVAAIELADAVQLLRLWPTDSGPLVATLTHDFPDDAWRALDLAREELRRTGRRVLLVLDPAQAGRMTELAPNLMSLFSASADTLCGNRILANLERESRLAVLRARYGITDQEMEEQWRQGALSPDPDLAEWIILLGKADLLKGVDS